MCLECDDDEEDEEDDGEDEDDGGLQVIGGDESKVAVKPLSSPTAIPFVLVARGLGELEGEEQHEEADEWLPSLLLAGRWTYLLFPLVCWRELDGAATYRQRKEQCVVQTAQ
ncbi:hypothetical protein Pelo_3421 [Pelomyxa schiedti]|nr:hypothetical protein Pelo_3421 [Pelomyxa schiedti]